MALVCVHLWLQDCQLGAARHLPHATAGAGLDVWWRRCGPQAARLGGVPVPPGAVAEGQPAAGLLWQAAVA